MVVRYPAVGLTKHGFHDLIKGDIPMVWLESFDGTVIIDLMGGRSIPDRRIPESVQLTRGGLKGLIPPWRSIDQKGASEDGVTWIDSLYDPAEVTMTVNVYGRDRTHVRQVARHLIDSIDTKRPAKLHFWTHQLGHWWAYLRWFKTPPDPNQIAAPRKHRMTLILRSDSAFWRADPSVDMWAPAFADMTATFDFTEGSAEATELGDWPLYYWGDGHGYIRADGSKAYWQDETGWFTDDRELMAGPYPDFDTETDYQVVTIHTGSGSEPSIPRSAGNDIWARVGRNEDGTWNGYGVRFRVAWGLKELAYFSGFDGDDQPIKTVMRREGLLSAPKPRGEDWTLVAGVEGDPRKFLILRNGLEVMWHKEAGEGSEIGEDFRGIGFGMLAAGSLVRQATPASVKKVTAADNTTVTQSGYLTRINVGDQSLYDTYTVFGPGLFKFWLGPAAGPDDYVEFGPLLANQVVQLNTDPRSRSVQDLTSTPPTPQELTAWQKAIENYYDAAGRDGLPLIQQIKSMWGILPPQGALYSLLKGRWNDASAIPPKPAGESARPYRVKVSVDDGSPQSKIIASGVPRRRYPV